MIGYRSLWGKLCSVQRSWLQKFMALFHKGAYGRYAIAVPSGVNSGEINMALRARSMIDAEVRRDLRARAMHDRQHDLTPVYKEVDIYMGILTGYSSIVPIIISLFEEGLWLCNVYAQGVPLISPDCSYLLSVLTLSVLGMHPGQHPGKHRLMCPLRSPPSGAEDPLTIPIRLSPILDLVTRYETYTLLLHTSQLNCSLFKEVVDSCDSKSSYYAHMSLHPPFTWVAPSALQITHTLLSLAAHWLRSANIQHRG